MSIKTGITSGTPAKILFGAGVYFQGVEYSEQVAPTEEAIRSAIIGATQEGGTLTITPEFFAPELDGATVSVMELQNKVGETAQKLYDNLYGIQTGVVEDDMGWTFPLGF